jgi:hypothetical protein
MDDEKWAKFYSSDKKNVSKIFIKVMTSDGEHFFFSDYDKWYSIKEYCQKNSVFIKDLHLQFRSNKCPMDIGNPNAIYLVRSALGSIGQPTKNYYTFGVLKDDGLVHKQMWLVPELILDKEYTDDLSACFEEALIYNDEKKKNRKKQV